MVIHRVTDQTDRRDIELMIEDVAAHAHTITHIHAGTDQEPTAWDRDHARMNALLGEWVDRAAREAMPTPADLAKVTHA